MLSKVKNEFKIESCVFTKNKQRTTILMLCYNLQIYTVFNTKTSFLANVNICKDPISQIAIIVEKKIELPVEWQL